MTPWRDRPVPEVRDEALFGDRIVRCFVDRPTSVLAMFEAAREAHPQGDAVVFGGRRWSYADTGPKPSASRRASRRAASAPATAS